jgi:hypothetical protein
MKLSAIPLALHSNAKALWLSVLICALASVGIWQAYSSWQPPVDAHAFRQSQTAVTAAWLLDDRTTGTMLTYETPVFGEPWKVPYEFPVFQAVTALISEVSGSSIAQCGRLVSSFFWMACFIPIYCIYRLLGLGFRDFTISSLFLACSPLYLYWGRSILIESTAIFFGLCFLLGVLVALVRGVAWWWLAAFLAGLLCALVKATTFPAFGLAAVGLVLLVECRRNSGSGSLVAAAGRHLAVVALIGGCIVLLVLLWTRFSDGIKSENPIAALTTSAALHGWNYGSLAQRLDGETWSVLWDRASRNILGKSWVLGLLVAGLPFVARRDICLVLGMIGLFIAPLLIFTNLHLVHDYYQFANGLWLLMALGLVVSAWFAVVPKLWGVLTILLVLASQLVSFRATYLPLTRVESSPAMEIAQTIISRLPPEDVIIVIGDDWSPEIAFFTDRRCIYIPSWVSEPVASDVLTTLAEQPSILAGPLNIGAVIVSPGNVAESYRQIQKPVSTYLRSLEDLPSQNISGYQVYWKR